VSETVELNRESNFFERRVSEYQIANDLFADFDAQEHGWDDPLDGMK
jgi:ribonucleotide reductase beta subunit family protein with ferritin-like domain